MARPTAEELEFFDREGYVILRGALDTATVKTLTDVADDIVNRWTYENIGIHNYESVDGVPTITRSENLVPNSPELKAVVTGDGWVCSQVSAIMREQASLYKEKINYKLPGGAGWGAHQDAPAYRFVDYHVTCAIPLDPMTIESGCLWVARKTENKTLLKTDARNVIDPEICATIDWVPAEIYPGDILWFDSYVPHYSGPNKATHSRRSYYITYNRGSAGDLREVYYEDKEKLLAKAVAESAAEGRNRISVTDDFLGKPAPYRPKGGAKGEAAVGDASGAAGDGGGAASSSQAEGGSAAADQQAPAPPS